MSFARQLFVIFETSGPVETLKNEKITSAARLYLMRRYGAVCTGSNERNARTHPAGESRKKAYRAERRRRDYSSRKTLHSTLWRSTRALRVSDSEHEQKIIPKQCIREDHASQQQRFSGLGSHRHEPSPRMSDSQRAQRNKWPRPHPDTI